MQHSSLASVCRILLVYQPRRSLLLQSLLSEEYGLELRATQTALILVMAKGGIAAEQLFFSRLLATGATAGYFVPSVIVIMAIDAALLFLLFCWAGAVFNASSVIDFGDLMILGMAFPNILAFSIACGLYSIPISLSSY